MVSVFEILGGLALPVVNTMVRAILVVRGASVQISTTERNV
jgi:hypothetical protein